MWQCAPSTTNTRKKSLWPFKTFGCCDWLSPFCCRKQSLYCTKCYSSAITTNSLSIINSIKMMRRPRATTVNAVKYKDVDSDLSFSQTVSSDEDAEEWRPPKPKSKAPNKTARGTATGEKKTTTKKTAKPKEAKAPKEPKAPKVPKEPKLRAPRKPAAGRKTQAAKSLKDSEASVLAGMERKKVDNDYREKTGGIQTDCPEETRAEESGTSVRTKEERVSFIVSESYQRDRWADEGSSQAWLGVKKEEVDAEDFTFDEPCLKKQKTSAACMGRPTNLPSSEAQSLRNELNMNWDLIEVLSHLTCVERWVCANIIMLLREENTVPFMVLNVRSLITSSVQCLCFCLQYSPYKKGSKLTKARRAKALGLEDAASALMNTPHTLDLRYIIDVCTCVTGLSSVEEVATGVEHILADMMAKDPETLTYEKEQDIDKFQLYFDFTCNIQRIQPHQTLAINRGESLKILTVKVNIPDRVKSDFTRWCINNRWRPKTFAKEELHAIIRNAVEDSYKRLILPFLTRSYRTKLTSAAEKESIAMFVRNLRQRLLVCPVRGCVIMGVDPGFRHGCKLAILSPTSQILQTDVVYLHNSNQPREAEKLRHLMTKYSCSRVVIGNGTACRETESFFADLISRRYFHPLDVSYCITNEAGASIYSVSPEAVQEMPDLDPNLRSAVSIGRRVQDPLAELVKIDPKHIGIGTYQHDVSAGALKTALDGVVQECVSFVGVDINICSEILMRHVAGLNAGRARSITEWREQHGPFINREQLKLVKGMGPKSYQQCAGFIRINPQTLSRYALIYTAPEVPEKPAAKKGKGKTGVNVSTSFNPLDQTCIHPESYHVAQRFLSLVGGSVDQIGSTTLKHCVENKVKTSSVEELARTLDTTPETLKLIIDGLTQPPGFDIRQNFGQADFKRGVVSMSDLRVGAVLTGRVDNTALFGAFVDIGVGRAGLIHKSNITLDKLPVSQRRRSLALGPGERVEVRVLNVDLQRGRIGLDLIRVLQ
uniref:S1 motif domain-containing protein n=1 Tax=Astatotilapia calliptera TaxID=8154 RepID=A0AAX7VYB4_ASTCA